MSPPGDMRRLLEENDPPFDDVMACVYGIGGRDVRTYLELIDHPESTVEELAAELDRDRSNVNRSLAHLRELDLAYRERRLLDTGGYVYQYSAEPLPRTKARLHEALDRWAARVHDRIDRFDQDWRVEESEQ